MAIFDDVFTADTIPIISEVLAKLGIGALLGGAIGYERERSGRPAGIRTHMLLVLGVVLISEVSRAYGAPDNSRIAAQIVTGVGFLGAGTILRTGVEVKGLTTAASLWAAAAIGMAVSTGGAFLLIAAAATVLTLFTLSVVDRIERRLVPDAHPKDLLVTLPSRERLAGLLDDLSGKGWKVDSVSVVSSGPPLQVELGIYGPATEVLRDVMSCEGVLRADWA